uniref:Uncharacterized protein n=1 Tax=Ditylenchus dipsaci TaxID=166011 RepID=A0A915DPR9_9BILA
MSRLNVSPSTQKSRVFDDLRPCAETQDKSNCTGERQRPWHWSAIVIEENQRQIATLPVEFPQANSLLGSTIFSYSLRSSLNYAVCSFMSNSSFVMEPELSFMDTTYSDVVFLLILTHPVLIGQNIAEQDSQHTGRPQKLPNILSLWMLSAKSFLLFISRESRLSLLALMICFLGRIEQKSSEAIWSPLRRSPKTNRPVNTLIKATTRKGDDKYSTKLFTTNKLSNQSSPNCVLELPKFSAAQMKSHKSSKSKDRSTTTTISPKTQAKTPILLPSTSSEPLLPTTTMSSILRGKSSITTIKLETNYDEEQVSSQISRRLRFQHQLRRRSASHPTSFKEIQQKGRIDTPKQQPVSSMDESFPAGYSDYENSEEDNGFHGGGDNPLGLPKTEEKNVNSQGVTTKRWQNTRTGWPSIATTAKPTEKEKTDKPAAQPNTFVDRGEPSIGVKLEFGLQMKSVKMLVISSLITIDIVFSLFFVEYKNS